MQEQTHNGSGDEAITNIKRFRVKNTWKDYEVLLEVDLARLTPKRAALINEFWSGAQDRVAAEHNDVVNAVIRMFGQVMMNMMLAEGGSSFSGAPRDAFDDAGPVWTSDLHNEEGWGGIVDGSGFGWCGIRVIAADVQNVDFDEVELQEVSNG